LRVSNEKDRRELKMDKQLEHAKYQIEESLMLANLLEGNEPVRMKLSERMAQYYVPGLSLAVVQDGQIAWSDGYGTGEAGSDAPVSPNKLFQAASISKPVTALAALRLVQDGRLSLDQDVNHYLRSWCIPDSQFTQQRKVTLRDLLSHTAGINASGFPGYADGEPVPTLIQILDGAPPANTPPIRIEAEPGKQWLYSGGGYVIIQQMLEDITGDPFPLVIQRLVLDPLEMQSSLFDQPLPIGKYQLAAVGHDECGQPIPGKWHTYPEMAAAGLWTTSSDLARFAMGIQDAFLGVPGSLLSVDLAQSMLKVVLNGYSLGLSVHETNQGLVFGHSGGNRGYRCFLAANASTGQGLVVMTNASQGSDLCMEVARAVAHVYDWDLFQPKIKRLMKLEPAQLEHCTGRFTIASDPGTVATVTREEDHLFIRIPSDNWTFPLYPESETEFFMFEKEEPVIFELDQNQIARAFRYGNYRLERADTA
jgi:CubicO group peptidase (beta-lactamase class C family)